MTEIIESGFIFLDIKHPLVAWECYRGILITPQSIEKNTPPHPSVWLAGIINSKDNSKLCNEFIFEYVRANYFPNSVSRLSCLYVFKTPKEANVAMNWGSPHFNNQNLINVKINADKISRVDSKWVTHTALNKDNVIEYEYIEFIHKYWNGEQYDDDPHWEYLIEGSANILDEKILDRALI